MSKKINWSTINATTIEAMNAWLNATSASMKDAVDLAQATFDNATSAKEAIVAERDLCKTALINDGMSIADAIAESTRKYAERLNDAHAVIADAETALEDIKARKRALYNKSLGLIPESVYKAYKASLDTIDHTAYVQATAEMLAGFGLEATEVQTAKLADKLAFQAGGASKSTGKKALEGRLIKEKAKRTFNDMMLRVVIDHMVFGAKSFRYNEGRTAITLYTGEDKQEQA